MGERPDLNKELDGKTYKDAVEAYYQILEEKKKGKSVEEAIVLEN